MKIFLHELSDQETELHFTQEEAWVVAAVERVDERPEEFPPFHRSLKHPPARNIDACFSLRKVDEVVVVNGQIKTEISLLCSRCAAPFRMKTSPGFSALFCKDPVMAGIAHLDASHGILKPAGQNKGFARHAHDFDGANNPKTGETGQDLDITYLSQDFIELGDVLTEQLRLEIPFQPLCKESCQGMCTQCGADLNAGRCACAKIIKQTPFVALKNLKI